MEQYKTSFQAYLGNVVKAIRLRNRISQEQMAELLRITTRSYSDLERNRFCISLLPFIFLLFQLSNEEIIRLVAELRRLTEEIEHESR